VWSKELYIKIKWNRLTSISKYDLENVYINKKILVSPVQMAGGAL
jgi:hypothetical protein